MFNITNRRLDSLESAFQSITNRFNTRKDSLNSKQQEAITRILRGESIVLTGGPGTGKTFTINSLVRELISQGLPIVTFRDPRGSTLDQEDKLAFACVAATNRAVNNMVANLYKYNQDVIGDLEGNFMTAHKLLEVAPNFYEKEDGTTSMKFEPRRGEYNRLPLKLLIIEEASTCGLDLWEKLYTSLEPDTQIVLLGDINQIRPVFGNSILNYGLIKLPVVELTHVYRQALDSPIIRQAYRILNGKPPITDTEDFTVISGKANRPIGAEFFGEKLAAILSRMYDKGDYSPKEDIVLLPYNKNGAGVTRVNKLIQSNLDAKLPEPPMVYEVISGVCKHYFAVGDYVYDGFSKQSGVITAIKPNGAYFGAVTKSPSTKLSRYGTYTGFVLDDLEDDLTTAYDNLDVEQLLNGDTAEETLRSSSHIITVLLEDGEESSLTSAGEVNLLDFGYCLTCHKAQGSEWRNVIVAMHDSHYNTNREWLYTSVTRARERCWIIARQETIAKVTARQSLRGVTLEEKIAAFNEDLNRPNATKYEVNFDKNF